MHVDVKESGNRWRKRQVNFLPDLANRRLDKMWVLGHDVPPRLNPPVEASMVNQQNLPVAVVENERASGYVPRRKASWVEGTARLAQEVDYRLPVLRLLRIGRDVAVQQLHHFGSLKLKPIVLLVDVR